MSRAMKKKIVFLPYDMDTAIGINNEGSLVFSYNLEDTDHLPGGADVFNGQQSVLWNLPGHFVLAGINFLGLASMKKMSWAVAPVFFDRFFVSTTAG